LRDQINRRFFVWVNKLLDKIEKLEGKTTFNVIIYQLTKSSLSSSSNYRVSIRAKSTKDMIYKLKIAEEELDESIGWLEILNYRSNVNFSWEMQEASELLAIIVKSIMSLKKKLD
jgi:four helix bundle protein